MQKTFDPNCSKETQIYSYSVTDALTYSSAHIYNFKSVRVSVRVRAIQSGHLIGRRTHVTEIMPLWPFLCAS